MEKRIYRMYGLVPYNISPIQQAIQYGHAVVEYANDHFNEEDYQKWARKDKTFIILNGGTTNINTERLGSLNAHMETMYAHGLKFAMFYEPDLGDQLTAIVFLVDDRVWDRENWPDYQMPYAEQESFKDMKKNATPEDLPGILESFESYRIWFNKFSDNYKEAEHLVWLRDFTSPRNFRLA
jgi:hypothetical protein